MTPGRRTVLIALDKLKGSLSAAQAGAALARGLREATPAIDAIVMPLADGGDGTVEAACAAGFEARTVTVAGPTGEPVEARFAVRGADAVLELAEASGLRLLPGGRLDHGRAHTAGLGQLILAARDAGATRLVIGLGGSASTDGGAGMLQALGARLLDREGKGIPFGHDGLVALSRIDLAPARDAVAGLELLAACDVTSPLLGPSGAAAVFGPQKGLAGDEIDAADDRLARFADLAEDAMPPAAAPSVLRPRDIPGAGAAGGTGFALALLGARFVSGADAVLDLLRFDELLARADLVITGEGRLDAQTLTGKGPAEVARRARAAGVPVIAVAGSIELTPAQLRDLSVGRAYDLISRAAGEPGSQERVQDAMARAEELLEAVGRKIGAELRWV